MFGKIIEVKGFTNSKFPLAGEKTAEEFIKHFKLKYCKEKTLYIQLYLKIDIVTASFLFHLLDKCNYDCIVIAGGLDYINSVEIKKANIRYLKVLMEDRTRPWYKKLFRSTRKLKVLEYERIK